MKTLGVLLTVSVLATTPSAGQTTPTADNHQHLFSPDIALMLTGRAQGLTAVDLLALLDQAGIRRAAVYSAAYMYGSPARSVENEYEKVKAENDWIGAQAAGHPERLRALCSFNPLRAYALSELARCAADPNLRHGLKLHFGNSDVQLEKPEHVERLARVFRLANEHRMAIVVHLRASVSNARPYGRAQAQVFLDELLPLVPDVPVQVAHLAGTGPGFDDPAADSALAALAEAVQRRDPRTGRLWFDVATVADPQLTPENAARLVRRIRQIGVDRVLYGSDAAAPGNLLPREGWAVFQRLPLSVGELATIASNVAPYLH